MKAYSIDLRRRVVKFVRDGGGKAEAARRFGVARCVVYRYLAAEQRGSLAPKTSWGGWRKLDPAQLRAHLQRHPDATLHELRAVFQVSIHALWKRLRQLGLTLKKSHALSRTQQSTTVAVPARTGAPCRPPRLLSGRKRR